MMEMGSAMVGKSQRFTISENQVGKGVGQSMAKVTERTITADFAALATPVGALPIDSMQAASLADEATLARRAHSQQVQSICYTNWILSRRLAGLKQRQQRSIREIVFKASVVAWHASVSCTACHGAIQHGLVDCHCTLAKTVALEREGKCRNCG